MALVLATAVMLADWPFELVEAIASVGYEAGPLSLWQDEDAWLHAQACVMHTAVNRIASPNFPGDEGVADEYFGAWDEDGNPIEPTDQQLELALQVLHMDRSDDPTGGCLYAMSAQDVINLEWPEADYSVKGKAPYGEFFYREWHGLPENWDN